MKRKTVAIVLMLVLLTLFGCQGNKNESYVEYDYFNITLNGQLRVIAKPLSNKDIVDLINTDSINILVNKNFKLPNGYIPLDLVVIDVSTTNAGMQLRKEASEALSQMFSAAAIDNINLMVGSAYRSYDRQVSIYANCVISAGKSEADRSCAKAGYSEHQTGLAVDLTNTAKACYLKQCFSETTAGIWLKENAYKYGFVLRYTSAKEEITGYKNEPWHYRYIGIIEAKKVHDSGLCLEEYYGILK